MKFIIYDKRYDLFTLCEAKVDGINPFQARVELIGSSKKIEKQMIEDLKH